MRSLLIIGGAALLTGCPASPTPPPVGGPCSYETVQGPCHLEKHEEMGPTEGGTDVALVYRTSQPVRTVRHAVFMPDGEEGALDAFLERYRTVECSGEVITEGTCNPQSVTFAVPNTVSAEEANPGGDAEPDQPQLPAEDAGVDGGAE